MGNNEGDIMRKLADMIAELERGAHAVSVDRAAVHVFCSLAGRLIECCDGVSGVDVSADQDKIWGGASVTIICESMETEDIGLLFTEAAHQQVMLAVVPAFEDGKLNVMLTVPHVYGIAKE